MTLFVVPHPVSLICLGVYHRTLSSLSVGKMCRISQTSPGGLAVKHLCGQGDLYVRLKRDVTTHEKSPLRSDCESFSGEDEVMITGASRNDHIDSYNVATPHPIISSVTSTNQTMSSATQAAGSPSSGQDCRFTMSKLFRKCICSFHR